MRLTWHTPLGRLVHHTSVRMASTIVGQSGRVYVEGEVLWPCREDHKLSVFKAESENESFVFKRVPKSFYDMSLRLAVELRGSRRLRIHIDCNQEEGILVYPYFRTSLLLLIREDPRLLFSERKKILRRLAEAIHELHRKDWVHIDIKPHNILVNWTYDQGGNKRVTDVALSDFDIAFKSQSGKPRNTHFPVGDPMWRSPEGQTGRGMTKASDIFSFGLVCIYTLGGGELLLLKNQEPETQGLSLERAVLIRHFSYFGPASEGLLKLVNSEVRGQLLKTTSEIAEKAVKDVPQLRFEQWGAELEARHIISGVTNPDPASRLTADQVLAHPWWREAI
ncbi:kinase-like domain-containing protein [Xylaria sp. FL1777]|nr:kinase-like domain-containing protein [Xylaria sp. FL1777]